MTLTVNPSVYKKLPFDHDKDFRPLSIITTSGNMLVVHSANFLARVRIQISQPFDQRGDL